MLNPLSSVQSQFFPIDSVFPKNQIAQKAKAKRICWRPDPPPKPKPDPKHRVRWFAGRSLLLSTTLLSAGVQSSKGPVAAVLSSALTLWGCSGVAVLGLLIADQRRENNGQKFLPKALYAVLWSQPYGGANHSVLRGIGYGIPTALMGLHFHADPMRMGIGAALGALVVTVNNHRRRMKQIRSVAKPKEKIVYRGPHIWFLHHLGLPSKSTQHDLTLHTKTGDVGRQKGAKKMLSKLEIYGADVSLVHPKNASR